MKGEGGREGEKWREREGEGEGEKWRGKEREGGSGRNGEGEGEGEKWRGRERRGAERHAIFANLSLHKITAQRHIVQDNEYYIQSYIIRIIRNIIYNHIFFIYNHIFLYNLYYILY